MSYLTDERAIYRNVFGITKYDPNTGKNVFAYDVSAETAGEPANMEIEDLITRETKMAKSIYATERALSAVTNPIDYLEKKKEDLSEINGKLVAKYKEIYPGYLDRYHDPQMAYKRAMSEVNELKNRLMEDHRYMFPTQIKGDKIMAGASTTAANVKTEVK